MKNVFSHVLKAYRPQHSTYGMSWEENSKTRPANKETLGVAMRFDSHRHALPYRQRALAWIHNPSTQYRHLQTPAVLINHALAMNRLVEWHWCRMTAEFTDMITCSLNAIQAHYESNSTASTQSGLARCMNQQFINYVQNQIATISEHLTNETRPKFQLVASTEGKHNAWITIQRYSTNQLTRLKKGQNLQFNFP